MIEQLQNENKGFEETALTGELFTPNERQHLFANIDAVCEFIKTFKIRNANIRYGQDVNGRMVYQLIYAAENN